MTAVRGAWEERFPKRQAFEKPKAPVTAERRDGIPAQPMMHRIQNRVMAGPAGIGIRTPPVEMVLGAARPAQGLNRRTR